MVAHAQMGGRGTLGTGEPSEYDTGKPVFRASYPKQTNNKQTLVNSKNIDFSYFNTKNVDNTMFLGKLSKIVVIVTQFRQTIILLCISMT